MGCAGVVLEASFAILRPSMAIFSAEITLPRPFGRWELSVMVEMQGGCEKAVRRGLWGRTRTLINRRALRLVEDHSVKNVFLA